ncbi:MULTISPECIES: hypothetical protein [Parabacteroides]|uniref:Uncharacterized protein n=1 Tax=Parabacteroides chinchillae TaxID=871327 RepID=A0A8G2F3Q1_9BACT|nr:MULTISPECIES: hypothetical protein [Parabacteroides]SEF40972.1 hypothetical protein SAMN05444001_10161 [Parabacteroides chinchillae]
MKRLSTQCMNEADNKAKKNPDDKNSMPRKQTLDFLSQFARVYHAEPLLRADLCGLVMN